MAAESAAADNTRVTVDRYRALSDEIAASVAVLTVDGDAGVYAITVDSYLDISYDPPTMAVSVYEGSRMADTLETADRLTLSVLSVDQKGIAQWLGEPGQPAYGLMQQIPTAAGEFGPPHIAGCVAFFELEIAQTIDIATHTLYAGPVRACGREQQVAEPLLYRGGEYFRPASLGRQA